MMNKQFLIPRQTSTAQAQVRAHKRHTVEMFQLRSLEARKSSINFERGGTSHELSNGEMTQNMETPMASLYA